MVQHLSLDKPYTYKSRDTHSTDTSIYLILELTLKLQEKEKIREIIKTHYKEDKTGSVPCEEVHIVVEDRLEHVVDYTVVEDVVLEEFRSKGIKTGDYR